MNEDEINAAIEAIKREQKMDPKPILTERYSFDVIEFACWRQRENSRLKRLHELECQAASLVVVGQATG